MDTEIRRTLRESDEQLAQLSAEALLGRGRGEAAFGEPQYLPRHTIQDVEFAEA